MCHKIVQDENDLEVLKKNHIYYQDNINQNIFSKIY